MRGVMEKCTYCVQRIERAKIGAKVANPTAAAHPLPDGSVTPACAQACPAEAIVFGNLRDPNSRARKLQSPHHHYQEWAGHEPRSYARRKSGGTSPRRTYLPGLVNPNPKMSG